MVNKAASLLGICRKAKLASSGEFAVTEAVNAGMARLVIIADDASDNTKKKFRNKCEWYKVPVIIYETKENLGHWIGCSERSVVSINDAALADKLLEIAVYKTAR